jgi:hypothetical protein
MRSMESLISGVHKFPAPGRPGEYILYGGASYRGV